MTAGFAFFVKGGVLMFSLMPSLIQQQQRALLLPLSINNFAITLPIINLLILLPFSGKTSETHYCYTHTQQQMRSIQLEDEALLVLDYGPNKGSKPYLLSRTDVSDRMTGYYSRDDPVVRLIRLNIAKVFTQDNHRLR